MAYGFKYRAGDGTIVEAQQFIDGEGGEITSSFPSWMIDMLCDGRIAKHSKTKQWSVKDERGVRLPLANYDWLVQTNTPIGLVVMSDSQFQRRFKEYALP